ncbi:adhesin [Aeromonas phage AerS_266]|nr:adhesin [Aeromonas phage AerS_266]
MTTEKKTFPRWVRDPLFSPIKQFLNKRLKLINEQGDLVDQLLASDRYKQMKPEDFVAEDVFNSLDGKKRFCLVRRNKQFARVDLELEQVRLKDIFSDQSVPFISLANQAEFTRRFKLGEIQNKLLYLAWRDAFGVCFENGKIMDLAETDKLFNHIFFDELHLERADETTIDPNTLTSGVIRVNDRSCSDQVVHVFVTENIVEQLALDRIVDNFPTTMILRRGDSFRHLTKIMIGDEDVTGIADVSYVSDHNRINVSQTTNKLETIFKAIRGSSTEELTENVTINISVNFMGETFTKQTVVVTRIVPDVNSELKLEGYPIEVTVPSGRQIGIVVKGKFNNENVSFTQAPSMVTSLVTGVTLTSQGSYRGGVLYLGTCNANVPQGSSVRDLLKGNFVYLLNGIAHNATAFVELTINPSNPDLPGLINTTLTPTLLEGTQGSNGNFTFVNELNNVVIPNTQLDIPTTDLGTKRLIRFTGFTTNKVNYTLFNLSGNPGTIESESVTFTTRYIDPITAIVYTRQDSVTSKVITLSDLALIPLLDQPIFAEKYDYGLMPFKPLINGNQDNSKVVSIEIIDINNYVKPTIFGNKPKGTWQVFNTGTEEETISVSFKVGFNVDETVRYLTASHDFKIASWSGNNLGVIPREITISGKAGESGEFTQSFFENMTFANTRLNFIPELSNLPPELSIVGKTQSNTEWLKGSYQLFTTGSYVGFLTYSLTDGTNDDDSINVPLKATILPGEELFFNVTGITESKPLLPGVINCNVQYKGVNIPLNDPRVRLEVELSNEAENVFTIGQTSSEGVTFNSIVDNIPMGGNVIYDMTIELNFIDDLGVTQTRSKEVAIKLYRNTFTSVIATFVTNPVKPIISDQVIIINIKDPDNDPLPGGLLDSVLITNDDNQLGPVQSYRNALTEKRGQALGNYELKTTTNHFGGNLNTTLKINIGGNVVDVIVPDTHVQISPIKSLASNTGIAVNNVSSEINFTLKQDKLNNLNVPVVAKRIENIRFSDEMFNDVTNLIMIDNNGNYKLDLVSAGSVGIGVIDFTLITNEINNTEIPWEISLEINMIRE